MTSDIIRAAIGALRASVEALPEHQREPWEYRATSVYMNGTSHGSVVAAPHVGPSPVSGCTGAVGEHIERLHNATGALIDLLEAVDRLWESDLVSPAVGDVLRTALPLAEAITHRSTT